jgi:hypothetical protein
MPISPDEAVRLERHEALHDEDHNNWRVNGRPKIWASGRFRVPLKYGLYGFGYLDERNFTHFHRASECPYENRAHFEKIQTGEQRGWERREGEIQRKMRERFER